MDAIGNNGDLVNYAIAEHIEKLAERVLDGCTWSVHIWSHEQYGLDMIGLRMIKCFHRKALRKAFFEDLWSLTSQALKLRDLPGTLEFIAAMPRSSCRRSGSSSKRIDEWRGSLRSSARLWGSLGLSISNSFVRTSGRVLCFFVFCFFFFFVVFLEEFGFSEFFFKFFKRWFFGKVPEVHGLFLSCFRLEEIKSAVFFFFNRIVEDT